MPYLVVMTLYPGSDGMRPDPWEGRRGIFEGEKAVHLVRKRLVECAILLAVTGLSAVTGAAAVGQTVATSLHWHDFTGTPEFHSIGDLAVLTIRQADGQVLPIRPIVDVGDAKAVLADKRLIALRPALLAWAGNDLVALRDRSLARAKQAMEAGLMAGPARGQSEQWTGGQSLSALLQYSRLLEEAGRQQEAVSLLRQKLGATPADAEHSFARVILTTRLAGVLFVMDHEDESILLLQDAVKDKTIASEDALNLKVNLAQYLARRGRSAEALPLIDAVWSEFGDFAPTGNSMKVPDSDANFAWIRACALNGLGRRTDADFLINGITAGPSDTTEVPVTERARISAFQCMHDPVRLASELAPLLEDAIPGGDIFELIQVPDYQPEREVTLATYRQPILAKAIAAHAIIFDPHFASGHGAWPPFAALSLAAIETAK